MTARAWDPVSLTVKWWSGEIPSTGDELRTRTGRRYQILRVVLRRKERAAQERGPISRLECMVLPPREPIKGRTFEWVWAPRGRRRFA